MKLTPYSFLPLLLIACSKETPASKPQPDQAKPAATQPATSPAPAAQPATSQAPAAQPATSQAPAAQPAATPPAATQPAAKLSTATPELASAPKDPAGAPKAGSATAPAPGAPASGTAPAPAPAPAAGAPAAPGSAPALGSAATAPATAGQNPPAPGPLNTAGPTPAPVKSQPAAVQLPTVPPTPCPVVLAPPSKLDQHAFSAKNLGGPIKVFDKVIDEEMIRRYLCYGVGSKHIDSLKFDVICRGEIAKRKAAGEDVSKLTVSDAEVEKSIEKMRKDFLIKYPTLDFPTEVGRAYLHYDVYMAELRPALLFDRTFFPEDPRTWPAVTVEAIVSASNGRQFIDDSIEQYDLRKQAAVDQGLDEVPPDDPILTDTLRQWLLDALNQFTVVESDPAKLPADALLVIDGHPIKIDDVWSVIAPHVTWEHVSEARRFLTQMAVAERDLRAKNVLMTQEEFEKSFAPTGSYKDALAAYEMVGLVLQGFPSMHATVRYEQLQRSYRKLIKDDIATDAPMMPYLQRANMIAGAAKIDAEVILASAYDFPNSRWKVDGWKSAEAKAKELKAKLDAGTDWGDTLELYSEFWDPPMPEVGQKPQFGFNFKGRFGLQTRNQLAGDLLESDYSIFLNGKCVADEIFFEQKGGTISDVMKGPRGYYIARVNSRTPATAGLNLAAAPNREFLVNYVCMQRFGAYARQLLTDAIAKGDVTGF